MMEDKVRKKCVYIYMYVYMYGWFTLQQKLTGHCKSTIMKITSKTKKNQHQETKQKKQKQFFWKESTSYLRDITPRSHIYKFLKL